jgi:hypothetical protein
MTAVMPYDMLAVVVNASTLGNPEEVLQLLAAIRYTFYAFSAVNAVGVIISFLRGPRGSSEGEEFSVQKQAPQPHSGHM